MPNNKKEIYNFYKEMLPRRKAFFKYVKTKTKSPNKELVEKITSYFEIGSSEASTYIDLMSRNDMTDILKEMGVEDKEIKKLLK